MASFYNAAEVAGAAVEIERRGQTFYKEAAAAAQDADTRKFFLFFAGEEARHEQLFLSLQKRVGTVELPAWATEVEYADYLGSLLDSHSLFNDPPSVAGMAKTQAVRMAMGFEKDTILFFHEMKALLPDSESPFIDQCIEEEKRHLKQLGDLLR